MTGKQLDPAAGFHDDGGTPQFRARRHAILMRPLWAVARFIWLFPVVAIGAVMIFFALWLLGIMLIGNPEFWADYWGWAALFAVVVAWDRIVGKGGLGVGALDFRGMMNSPSGGAWGLVATYFRSLFVWLYACYALFFWFIVGVGIWMWQSGALAHADAVRRGLAGG